MILISKNDFLKMFELKILNGNKKVNKEWTVTSVGKKSKRKKHYVDEAHYAQYLRMKDKNNNIT